MYLRDSLDSIINIYPVSRLDQNINVTNRGQLAFDSPSNSVYKQTIYLNRSATHRHRRMEYMCTGQGAKMKVLRGAEKDGESND